MRPFRPPGRSGPASLHRQRGVALAIVVWFIAGMSLLVAGIVAQARVDTHMAQAHVARAKAVAAGDGAIQLMMVDLMSNANNSEPNNVGNYQVGGIYVTVVLVPSSGLIDIGNASVDVLFALFLMVGKLPEEEARMLAETMVQLRTAGRGGMVGPDGAVGVRLDAVEDLLQVPGASRTLLDAVRDFIVVGKPGQGGFNPAQAPDELLDVLANADPAQVEAVRSRRGGGMPGLGGRGMNRAAQGGGMANAYRADAIVRYGDKAWLRRRWISMQKSSSSTLPWQVTRTEPPRVLMDNNYLLRRGA